MNQSAGISLRGIVKRFGSVEVIKGANLDVADGEFLVIVGPSGCGKSTLLRIVAGLEEATAGSVAIGGRDVTNVEPKDRDIAMVFQSYALYPHMTVFGNMAYGLRTRGETSEAISEKVADKSRLLQIEHLLDRRPRQLSGGQRQRVAMGRAMVRQPKVFLFDEPLSNLDAKLRGEMRVELRKLHEKFGITSLYVTHDQVEAMTLADRLVVMNSGRIEQIGRPIDIYLRPATVYVAGFIGAPAMNFLEGTLETSAEAVRLVDGSRLSLHGPVDPSFAGKAVTVGVRPESLTLSGSGTPDAIRVKIDLVERLGADTILHCRVGSEPMIARVSGRVLDDIGQDISLDIDQRALHLFDPVSTKRIETRSSEGMAA